MATVTIDCLSKVFATPTGPQTVIDGISQSNKQLAKLKMEKQTLRDKITELRNPQLLAELNTFQQQQQKISEEIVEIRTSSDSLKTQLTTIHRPELENIKKILDQQEREKKEFTEEHRRLKEQIAQIEKDLKEKELIVAGTGVSHPRPPSPRSRRRSDRSAR